VVDHNCGLASHLPGLANSLMADAPPRVQRPDAGQHKSDITIGEWVSYLVTL
jgi:hypothetical protein